MHKISLLIVIFSVTTLITSLKARGQQIITVGDTTDKVYTAVEKEPEFPGGIDKFFLFVDKNLHFQNTNTSNLITKVFIEFIIEKNGDVSNIKLSFKYLNSGTDNNVDSSLYKQITNLLKTSPKWKPASQGDHPVRFKLRMPITLDYDAGDEIPLPTKPPIYPDKYGIFSYCDEEPEFPGGIRRFYKFLAKNVKWPDKSRIIDVQGKVFVSFVVEKNGALTHFKILRGLKPLFDKEALRVMKLSPKWKPGKQGGKIVRVYYTVPINFALTN